MIKSILKSLQYLTIAVLGISLMSGCAQTIKPFDSNSLGQITFSFSDTDDDEGEIGGDIKLDIPESLIPAQLAEFVIYWGSEPNADGQGDLLATVPAADFTPPVLYTVPQNSAIVDEYFLLFLKGGDGKEVFSGKASLVPDRYEGVQVPEDTDVTKAAPAEAQPEEAADEPTETASAETPDLEPELDTTPAVKTETDEPAVETEAEPAEQQVYVVPIENVLFEFDKSYLRPEFKEQLRADLGSIENKDQAELLIAGHADERGSNEYNLALGERRAFSVKRFLISMGFLSENIRIISYGEEKPIDPGHDEEAWRKNRRAETDVQD